MSVADYEIQHSFHWIQRVNFISGLFTKLSPFTNCQPSRICKFVQWLVRLLRDERSRVWIHQYNEKEIEADKTPKLKTSFQLPVLFKLLLERTLTVNLEVYFW